MVRQGVIPDQGERFTCWNCGGPGVRYIFDDVELGWDAHPDLSQCIRFLADELEKMRAERPPVEERP